jgi:adenine phosphoribosyltransferase/phosphomevalonate kinase
MATLATLKRALLQGASITTSESSLAQPLSDEQYKSGFDILLQGPGWAIYKDFILPELSYLLAPIHSSNAHISVLEIGPGPKSILGYIPKSLRQRIGRYTAFEPNALFATSLKEWLQGVEDTGMTCERPFPGLKTGPTVHQAPFGLHDNRASEIEVEKYDIILFCHSMYGIKPQRNLIERALKLVVEGGIVAVFHRDGALHIDGLICHHTTSFGTGVVSVADDDEALDHFAPFVVGFVMQSANVDKAVKAEWRRICRVLGHREESNPDHILFSSPEVMVVFNHHASTLPELTAHVPLVQGEKPVKNKEACAHRSAPIVRPKNVADVQQCVQWALKHGVGLTVVGGGHSAHCLRPNVLAVDMSEFHSIHILRGDVGGEDKSISSNPLVVVEAGCKRGDVISKMMDAGLTVPLGSRPSVGTGSWLQGGIGHLTRLYGLACDAVVGAVLVSVASGEIIEVGCVPSQHRVDGAVRPNNDADLLWGVKGAGTNFGIVVSMTFRAYPALSYQTRNWIIPLSDSLEARRRLCEFDEIVAGGRDRKYAADAYLYCEADQMNLGISTFESLTASATSTTTKPKLEGDIWGPERDSKEVNGVELFEAEMYMSGMHGGHGGGKTSSFKRCIFLKDIGNPRISERLVAAFHARPSPFCYLHLLHGGGAVGDNAADATAFGCREWDFACVITGVWPRHEDGTRASNASVQWVYNVIEDLLSVSSGVYGADLGPDPRDAVLAANAFGSNGVRLARLKRVMDPHNVLAYACPLPKAPLPKLIVLVTGASCAGKDHCANVWVAELMRAQEHADIAMHELHSRVASISDATKREYAASTGADLSRLLGDRIYKEQHRRALTTFFKDRVRQRPRIPEEHFLDIVRAAAAADVDVLFVTGMRDEAPVAFFSHMVSDSKLLEVYVKADEHTRRARGAEDGQSDAAALCYRPSFVIENSIAGDEMAKKFAKDHLVPFLHDDLQRLAGMVRLVPNFPRVGVDFRHVLGISQRPGGLSLCISLLQSHFTGSWAEIDAVVSCEVGGLVYASALALRVDVPLVLIREASKLPPPTIAIAKASSYISSLTSHKLHAEKCIEIECDAVTSGTSVVVVDDVLSTGETLCAVLQLLRKAGIENVDVMVVAEFPLHRGRELLHQRGFDLVNVQSLLVFGGA